ncbi:TetR/AcrR family transcriptional regulator [Spirochaeta africana]|uniref:Transcriptional regulator n=1 Tax=Spirochaeta africana (strain ATCC 700263 / DSM 8902 / Z-7692) TaxID=889378 RepID=H9UG54_SPIAZ|nr:TetR/AcrR family transcriptional regulator [Spirochaeta africana]AFG36497.1 transcriptional regulator [Spirochaeta africana DSM 8902]
MTNKEIQEQRIKDIFVQAAMLIVREEGTAAVKVKRVADQAGYAAGTLYNYFHDLNELLFHCVMEFFRECRDHALKQAHGMTGPLERLLAIALGYSSYFLGNPNIYQLVFMADLQPAQQAEAPIDYQPEIVRIGAELLQQCAREGRINPAHADTILGLLANTIHGNLLFFLTGRSGEPRQDAVTEKIRREICWVLERSAPDGHR